ncbi:MAG: hypothetical protein K2N01_07785 [Lachnospiraceae bacterium]|nr:hypothetical protein [Lachnospiraceae bacterium]
MDDEYESITKANYWKHTDYWDRASDDLERFCIGVRDFVAGFVQGAVDVVVGLMDVVIGLVCLLTAGITWGIYKQYDLDPPDWASDRLEGAGNTATALLEDPLLIVEGISQGATDAVEQKAAGIGRHQDLSGDPVSTYQAGSISDLLAFQNASLRNGLQKNYITQTRGLVENSEAIYTQRQEAWEEEIRQRREQAMISMIAAVGTLIIGGIVIVCTFGMATPLVVGTTALTLSSVVSVSAGFAIGGATFLYGESNFCESYNSYQYGLKGDSRTVAENPIRDTCFAGDPELYYTVGNVCTMTASMMIPVGGSMTAAVNAGTSPVRAGLTELGMLGYSSVMASETADIVTDMTDSELAGMVAGTIVGMESYGGLKTLDQSVNISGLYSPEVPQPRSMKEIAGSNPELLGKTNGENSTQSKIGYEYLDEQLGSLKGKVKINQYQSAESVNDWWEIRGYKSPYKEKTVVQNVTLTEDTKFVRVYDGVNSNLEGGWVMRAEDIKGLTPKEIQAKFALEYEPKFIGEVELKAGDTIRLGEVGPNFGFGGGGIQIDLQQQWIGDFTELGTIENWR